MLEYFNDSYRISRLLSIIRRHWLQFALVFFITLMSFCVLSIYRATDRAACVFSMNYSGIEQGENPNGTRFSMNSVIDDDVLDRAIGYAGLSERIAADDISGYVSIYALSAASSSSDYYYSTSYRLSYTPPQRFSDELGFSAENMLRLICKAYKDVFYERYTANYDLINSEVVDVSTLDYSELQAYFTLKANQLNHFLAIRMNESESFASAQSGDTFRSLQQRVYNLTNYKIANYAASIWENGVVADYSHFVSTLNYKNFVIDQNYQKAYEAYAVQKEIIGEYDNAMTGIVLVPSYDTSNEFYMSRTKVGIDYLALSANQALSEAQSYLAQMRRNEDLLAKVKATLSSSAKAAVDAMSSEIASTLKTLIAQIEALDAEYLKTTTRNYFVFQQNTISLLDKIDLKYPLAAALLTTIALIFLYYVRVSELEKEKGRQHTSEQI